MSYCTTCDVYSLVHTLVAPASAFDTSTCPSLSDVTTWVTAGSSAIDTQLASNGYGPIPANSTAYALAGQCNALFAALFAEESRTNARVSADERTRGDRFKRDYEALMKVLVAMDLSRAGVSSLSGGRAYAGGISVSDRATVESDTDRVQPRFRRGQFRNPGTLLPNNISAS